MSRDNMNDQFTSIESANFLVRTDNGGDARLNTS
ncbi:hypothetical protein SAMN05216218_11617 [Halorientalis regularis]|uniref:Uncharacterized protein n=1 Tax=Halorientalis regularis TaxID=660518 RepID=A0A1G7RVM1_9EURY|nr:hypothetical protein SAMN05216218_11617 [Halorientalis regularis]